MKIVLIDLSALFWRFWHVSETKEISTAKRDTVNCVTGIVMDYDYSAICVDSPPYIRSELYPEYKAGREKSAAAVEQLRETVRELQKLGIQLFAVKGYEADDCIATATKKAVANGYDVVIVGSDKDLLQLVDGEKVKMIEPFKREFLTSEEKFGVKNTNVIDVLALSGDKEDNIPGIEGVGIKKAVEIINVIGSVEKFLDLSREKQEALACNLPISLNEKLMQGLLPIEISYQLVKLNSDLPIELNFKNGKFEHNKEKEVVDEIKIASEGHTQEVTLYKPEHIIKADNRHAKWELSLEPTDIESAWRISKTIFASGLFGQFPKEQAVFAIIMRGRAMGMDAVTSLDMFHVIEGKTSMAAQGMVALCLSSGKAEYFELVETSNEFATWETKRRGARRELKLSYTIEQAEKAGLLRPTRSGRPSNWHSRPDEMLRWTCAKQLARLVYPDVIKGVYTPDEITEI